MKFVLRLFALAFLTSCLLSHAAESPVVPVPFGEAVNVTLDHYYDLLKTKIGTLGSEEYLQLKLVADPIDISDEDYRYWSHYILLNRSDVGIEPQPISSSVLTSAVQLNRVYGRFLQRLRSYVVRKELDVEAQLRLADIDIKIEHLKEKMDEYVEKEVTKWERYCKVTKTDLGDRAAYLQWSVFSGYKKELDEVSKELRVQYFDKKTVTDRQYANAEDREVIDAEYAYEEPAMRLRYPINPDYMYSEHEKFSLEYLATLPDASTALFDSRRALTWNVALRSMPTLSAGAFTAEWDRTTGASSSITTDWGVSGSGSYAFIKAKASASEHKAIADDFRKGTAIKLGAKAAFKTQILYPGWFQPQLFNHKRVQENRRDFVEFFGPEGSLLYYPVALVVVRGFAVSFESTQAWTYDYEKKFSASAGGGFSAFGISFGADANYGEHVTKHQVDKSNTTLKFSDGESTLRFVGYVVKKTIAGDRISIFAAISEPGESAKALSAADLNNRLK